MKGEGGVSRGDATTSNGCLNRAFFAGAHGRSQQQARQRLEDLAKRASKQASKLLWLLPAAHQVGGEQHLGAVLQQVLEGGHRGADAGVVGDVQVLQTRKGRGLRVRTVKELCQTKRLKVSSAGDCRRHQCTLRALRHNSANPQHPALTLSRGTFRSARTKTVLPSRSAAFRSPTDFLAMVATARAPLPCGRLGGGCRVGVGQGQREGQAAGKPKRCLLAGEPRLGEALRAAERERQRGITPRRPLLAPAMQQPTQHWHPAIVHRRQPRTAPSPAAPTWTPSTPRSRALGVSALGVDSSSRAHLDQRHALLHHRLQGRLLAAGNEGAGGSHATGPGGGAGSSHRHGGLVHQAGLHGVASTSLNSGDQSEEGRSQRSVGFNGGAKTLIEQYVLPGFHQPLAR